MRKFLNNKRGIELTINFIVILIIGIAMLSGALMLTTRLFGQASEYKATVDANTQNEIRNLITDSDDLVVIYPSRKTISKTKSYIFGVGVQNTLKTDKPDDEFALAITLSKALDKDKNEICEWYGGDYDCSKIIQNCGQAENPKKCFAESWVLIGGALKIEKNEVETFAVPITVSNKGYSKRFPSGLYIFNVCVCDDEDSPGNPSCKPTGTEVQCGPGYIENLYGPINKVYVKVS